MEEAVDNIQFDNHEDAFKVETNLKLLQPADRQLLYNYWLYKHQEKYKTKIQAYCDQYESLSKTYREISSAIQLQVLQTAAVIGKYSILSLF